MIMTNQKRGGNSVQNKASTPWQSKIVIQTKKKTRKGQGTLFVGLSYFLSNFRFSSIVLRLCGKTEEMKYEYSKTKLPLIKDVVLENLKSSKLSYSSIINPKKIIVMIHDGKICSQLHSINHQVHKIINTRIISYSKSRG